MVMAQSDTRSVHSPALDAAHACEPRVSRGRALMLAAGGLVALSGADLLPRPVAAVAKKKKQQPQSTAQCTPTGSVPPQDASGLGVRLGHNGQRRRV